MLHNLPLLIKMEGYQQEFSAWFLLGGDINVRHAIGLVFPGESSLILVMDQLMPTA